MNTPIHYHFQSARMIFRRPTAHDAEQVFAIYGDPATQTFNPAGPYKNHEEARINLDSWLEQWEQHDFGQWALSLGNDPERIVGFGGLTYQPFPHGKKVNLGYRFTPRVWGRGLATELAEAALHIGFKTPKLPEIWAFARENHHASRRILEKIGLRPIDIIPDPRGVPARVIYRIYAPQDLPA